MTQTIKNVLQIFILVILKFTTSESPGKCFLWAKIYAYFLLIVRHCSEYFTSITSLILITTQWERYYYPQVADEKSGSWKAHVNSIRFRCWKRQHQALPHGSSDNKHPMILASALHCLSVVMVRPLFRATHWPGEILTSSFNRHYWNSPELISWVIKHTPFHNALRLLYLS